MLKDSNGDIRPALKPGHNAIFYARVVSNLVFEAISELEVYSELHRQAQESRSLHTQYAAPISPTQDLPAEFLGALLKFMRKFYIQQPPVSVSSSKIHVTSRPGVKMNKTEGHLTWILRTLWNNDHTFILGGYAPPLG